MTPIEGLVAAEIRSGGPITVARYMELALYHHEHGYYSGDRTRTGWRGDFVTSPEIGSVFGALWAAGVEEVWTACGRPAPFVVTEIGPGEGRWAESLLDRAAARLRAALRLQLVERSPALAARQRRRLRGASATWATSLDRAIAAEHGFVFANELLDNLPVHVLEARGGSWLEVFVALEGNRLTEQLRPPTPTLALPPVVPPDGCRREVAAGLPALVTGASSLFRRGVAVFVDYGAEEHEVVERERGTLACYSEAGVDDRFLERPGEKDITAHVAWQALRAALVLGGLEPRGPKPQLEVLRALGAPGVDRAARAAFSSAAAEGRGADGVRALSTRQALGALSDPGGLGGLGVMTGTREIAHPAFA